MLRSLIEGFAHTTPQQDSTKLETASLNCYAVFAKRNRVFDVEQVDGARAQQFREANKPMSLIPYSIPYCFAPPNLFTQTQYQYTRQTRKSKGRVRVANSQLKRSCFRYLFIHKKKEYNKIKFSHLILMVSALRLMLRIRLSTILRWIKQLCLFLKMIRAGVWYCVLFASRNCFAPQSSLYIRYYLESSQCSTVGRFRASKATSNTISNSIQHNTEYVPSSQSFSTSSYSLRESK